jgi:hypothetical protein
MFTGLLEFQKQRTAKQAIGFYISWVLVGIILGGIVGLIGVQIADIIGNAPSNFAQGFKVGAKWGPLAAIPFFLTLGLLVTVKKKLGFSSYLLALISPCLAGFGGTLLGLIPVAYLTTKQSNDR